MVFGWKWLDGPLMDLDFAAAFVSLGVSFTVERIFLKDALVCNKPVRIQHVLSDLKQCGFATTNEDAGGSSRTPRCRA